jgi:hypothetical protein
LDSTGKEDTRPGEGPEDEPVDDSPVDAPKDEQEEVDKASEDSFPASDPPSY